MVKRMLLATAALLATLPGFAYQISSLNDVGEMADQASLVFRGEVIDVDYRDSRATKTDAALPHTFVTFRVTEVLHGVAPGETITLRFLGGRGASGRVMFVSGQPMFDVGDEDVLFVKDNGTEECPLVACGNGRIRMIDGMAYSDDGRSLRRAPDGSIRRGKSEALDAVDSFRIGDQMYRRKRGGDRTMDEGGGAPPATLAPAGEHLDGQALTAELTDRIHNRIPNDPYGLNKRARSVNPNAAFDKRASSPTALPEPVTSRKLMRITNPADQAEMNAVQRSRGNPVLSR